MLNQRAISVYHKPTIWIYENVECFNDLPMVTNLKAADEEQPELVGEMTI